MEWPNSSRYKESPEARPTKRTLRDGIVVAVGTWLAIGMLVVVPFLQVTSQLKGEGSIGGIGPLFLGMIAIPVIWLVGLAVTLSQGGKSPLGFMVMHLPVVVIWQGYRYAGHRAIETASQVSYASRSIPEKTGQLDDLVVRVGDSHMLHDALIEGIVGAVHSVRMEYGTTLPSPVKTSTERLGRGAECDGVAVSHALVQKGMPDACIIRTPKTMKSRDSLEGKLGIMRIPLPNRPSGYSVIKVTGAELEEFHRWEHGNFKNGVSAGKWFEPMDLVRELTGFSKTDPEPRTDRELIEAFVKATEVGAIVSLQGFSQDLAQRRRIAARNDPLELDENGVTQFLKAVARECRYATKPGCTRLIFDRDLAPLFDAPTMRRFHDMMG